MTDDPFIGRRVFTHPSPRAYAYLREAIATSENPLGDPKVRAALKGTDCPQRCFTEPEGACPHGYISAALHGGIA